MNTSARLALAIPLALALAACGDTTEVDDRVVETDDVEAPVDVTLPKVDVEYPEVPLDARGTVEYAGTYELHNRDGQIDRITLGDDGTYTWIAPDGTEDTGEFTWGEDNSRILITRDGETNAFAVAEGVLYRLPEESAPLAGERSEETTWRRSHPTSTDGTQADGNQADRPGE